MIHFDGDLQTREVQAVKLDADRITQRQRWKQHVAIRSKRIIINFGDDHCKLIPGQHILDLKKESRFPCGRFSNQASSPEPRGGNQGDFARGAQMVVTVCHPQDAGFAS